MLVFLELSADFSRGCADSTIIHSILKTHPPPIRELTQGHALQLSHRFGLCRIADMNLREHPFPKPSVTRELLLSLLAL
jgi:hypothetical protein